MTFLKALTWSLIDELYFETMTSIHGHTATTFFPKDYNPKPHRAHYIFWWVVEVFKIKHKIKVEMCNFLLIYFDW